MKQIILQREFVLPRSLRELDDEPLKELSWPIRFIVYESLEYDQGHFRFVNRTRPLKFKRMTATELLRILR